MKVYDSLVTQMDDGRIVDLLDWTCATYDQKTGIVVVPLHNDDSDEYYEIIQAMTAHYEINPDRITKADINLSISTVSGAIQFVVDVGVACKEFGCIDMTDDELYMMGKRMTRFINEQSGQMKTRNTADIIHLSGYKEG